MDLEGGDRAAPPDGERLCRGSHKIPIIHEAGASPGQQLRTWEQLQSPVSGDGHHSQYWAPTAVPNLATSSGA